MSSMATLVKNNNGGVGTQYRPFDWLTSDPFRSFFSTAGQNAGVEVTRTEQGYVVELPVAGYKPNEIDITLEDQIVTVTGKSEKRSFTRSLLLPDEIDAETIGANVEHGLLTLTLNMHAKAQPRKIQIQTTTEQ